MGYRIKRNEYHVETGNNNETMKTIVRTSRNGKWESSKQLDSIMVYGTHTPYSTGTKITRTVTNLETGEFWTDRYGPTKYFASRKAFRASVLTRIRLKK